MKLILVMAMSADGCIARNTDHAADWTGREDKKYFADITRMAGVVIMGSRTFDTLDSPLPDRLNLVMTRNRERKSNFPNLVFTDESPEQILHGLEQKGFPFAVLMGGANLNTVFMKKNLISEVHLTLVPRFFGTGLGLFDSPLNNKLELQNIEQFSSGQLLMIFRVSPFPSV